MIYNNLNRIKGILSARLGAEIPKFSNSGKIYKRLPSGREIMSSDGEFWVYVDDPSELYTNFGNSFYELPSYNNYDRETLHIISQSIKDEKSVLSSDYYKIPGGWGATPYTAVENASEITKRLQDILNNLNAQLAASKALRAISLLQTTAPNDPIVPSRIEDIISKKLEEAKTISELMKLEQEKLLLKDDKKAQFALNIGQASVAAINTLGSAFGASQQATDSETTTKITAAYDTVALAASLMGPYGEMVGAVMGLAKGTGDIIQGITGGTDLVTKTDQWMSSPLFSWNVGIINDVFAKKSDALGVDRSTLATVGSSYGGSADDILEMSQKADKKIGLFAGKERKKINTDIANARASLARMRGIADTATDQRLTVQSMGEQAGLAYSIMTDGGYNLKYTYAAKHGGSLEWNPVIELEWEPKIELNWELPALKEGGNIDINEELEWIPELKDGNKIRTIEELIEYAKQKNPRFIQRLSEEPRGIKFTDDNGNEVEGSHYLESRGNYVIPRIQEIDGELKFLSPQEAIDRAMESGNYLEKTPGEAILFAEQYKQGWPDFFEKFKKGGSLGDSDIPETEETTQKNVIPEGALHKNKHHMEHAEGLTKKGIPVIDDDGEQQAEIEHSEIIFTLEVTKKLEEYYEIFYSEESTNKEKEQAALDAGKLLVYQILENTEDRTGLIESCKKGGTLTFKKDTEDLIEEVLEWMPTVVIVEPEELEEKKEEKSKKKLVDDSKEELKLMIKEVLVEMLIK